MHAIAVGEAAYAAFERLREATAWVRGQPPTQEEMLALLMECWLRAHTPQPYEAATQRAER